MVNNMTITNKKECDLLLSINIFLLFFEIVFSYIFNSNFFMLLFAIHLMIALILENNLTNQFILYLSFISYKQITILRGTNLPNVLTIVGFVFCVKCLIVLWNFVKKKDIEKFKFIIFGILVFCIYYFVGVYFNKGVSFYYLSVLQTFLIVMIGVMTIKQINVIKIYKYYLVMFCFSIVLGVCRYKISALDEVLRFATVDGANRFTGLAWDTNFLGLQCCCNIGILVSLLEQKKDNKVFYSICLLFVLLAGLMTLSKMYILGLGVLFVMWLLTSKTQMKFKIILLAIIIVGVVLLYFSLPSDNSIKVLMNRFVRIFAENESLDKITTGRWDIWKAYITDWSSTPWKILFGSGLGYPIVSGTVFQCHSVYVEFLYAFGLIGVTLFIVVISACIAFGRNSNKNFYANKYDRLVARNQKIKENAINWLGIIALLICYIALGATTETNSIVMFLISCFVLDINLGK